MVDYYYLAKVYQEQRLCEAAKSRILRIIKNNHPKSTILQWFGNKLSAIHNRIKNRLDPGVTSVLVCESREYCLSLTVGS